MSKKSRKRRSSRPRLSEAQLEAYRARRRREQEAEAEAEAADEVAAEARAMPRRAVSSSSVGQGYTHWGSLDEEYAIIRADLIRMIAITALIVAILIVLTFVLR